MVVFIDSLKESLRLIKKHWYYLPLAVLLDFLFVLLLNYSSLVLNNAISSPLQSIIESAGRLTAEITSAAMQGGSTYSTLLSDPIVALSYRSLFLAAITFVAVIYAFWILFNGASWFISYKMAGEKPNLIKFFTKFSMTSAIWFGILSVTIALIVRFIFFALLRPSPLLSPSAIQIITTTINAVIFYFVLISLSLIPSVKTSQNIQKTFKYGVIEAPTFLAVFAIIIIVLYVVFALMTFIMKSPWFIIIAPFLTWARMYLMLTAKEISENN